MVIGLSASESKSKPAPLLPSRINWRLPVILTLRTWAVWNRNKRLSIILPILYSLCWVSCLVILVRFIDSITCKSDFYSVLEFPGCFYFTAVGAPPYPGFKGCLLTHANQEIVFLWALLIIWDARKCDYVI